MKKIMFGLSLLVALSPVAAVAATCPSSSPTVCILSVAPSVINTNTPTVVTFTAVVTDPAFLGNLPGALNLLKVDATGKTLATLGSFNDNGQNGDLVANDGIYSVQVTLNQASAGNVFFRASAAIKGKLLRALSALVTVTVQ